MNPTDKECVEAISKALENKEFENETEFKFYQTLQGFIIALYQINDFKTLKLEYLTEKVESVRIYLKRRNKFYNLHSSLKKSIIGALHSLKFFTKISSESWKIE